MVKWLTTLCLSIFCSVLKSSPIQSLPVDTPVLNVRAHADSILAGTVEPMDDDLTFACMDSLTSENAETRKFYFKVMRVIVSKSDGALSEMVGLELKQYFETLPSEFFDRYKELPLPERKSFVSFIGYEYFLSSPNANAAVDNAEAYFTMLEKQCPDKYKKELQEVKEGIINTIKEVGQ